MKIALVVSAIALAGVAVAQSVSWTSSDDFNQGTYFNTNSATDGELRLNQTGTAPLPYINVPVGGRQLSNAIGWTYTPGRLVRVNTLTGEIVGEYLLTPAQLESSPSRAVVDRFGNCWVTNRYEATGTFAVTKIGIIIGGTRYRKVLGGAFIADPLGEYVKDATFTTGIDRDGDGYIRTSSGKFANILAWNATAGKDLDSSVPDAAPGLVQEAEDELILVFKRYGNTSGQCRAVALDADDNIWLGGASNVHRLLKVNGTTGAIVDKIEAGNPYGGYFLFFDRGKIFGAYAAFAGSVTDVQTKAVTTISGTGASDISVLTPLGNGDMVCTHNQNTQNGRLSFINPSGVIYKAIDTPGSSDKRGIVVGLDGDIWYAARGYLAGGDMSVYRVKQDGTLVSKIYTGNRPCGLGLDSEGKIWVTHIGDGWTTKIDPEGDGGKGAIVGSVYVGTGSYNYSDGTGATTSVTSRDGEWRATHDSFRPGLTWGVPEWDATVPAKTGLEVFMRAADTQGGLIGKPFLPVLDGVDTNGAHVGRYLEVRVRMSRAADAPATLSPQFRSLNVRYAKGTFSGQVGLNNWLPKRFPNAVFELVNPLNGSVLETRNIPLGPFGAFGFKTNLRGQILLRVKSSHWLRSVQPFAQNHTDPGTHGLAFALINGDCDGDNYIGTDDYLVLNGAFDTLLGDAGYDERADLDGDGYVGTDDYLIFSASFDQSGD